MAEKQKKELSPLDFVLDFEANGCRMYLKLAARTRNLLGKKLFYSLAAEEIDHARKADETFNAGETQKAPSLPAVEAVLKDFFGKAVRSEFKKSGESTEAYELAMEMERKGYEAYENFLKKAKTEKEKSFFKWILNEEKEHLSAIANVYYYLTGSGDWLQEEESRRWNWMNM
ncbi:MAG: ferritin family protein [Endomicrobiales bacterium]|nr:ferritin family protein [Endomicrobiales bacterium]